MNHNRRLKILHWATGFPDPEYGHLYDQIFIAEHVRAAGLYHDGVVIHISHPPQLERLAHVSRSREYSAEIIRVRHRLLPQPALTRLLDYALLFRELLRLRLKSFRPDIIHVHIFASGRLPAGLARLWGLPLVVTEHWSALTRVGVLGQERLRLARRIYEQAALVLPVCEYLGQCIQERTGAAFKRRVILNAVDEAVFHCESSQSQQDAGPRLLCVARLEEPKDFPTLLNALALLNKNGRTIHLDVIGRGDPQPLMQIAAALGVEAHVIFLGERPKTAIAAAMRSAQVFVLSSLWENSPCVIGEALCCGLPVVATAVGGVPELVPEGAGCLVPPGDPQAMASALAEALDNPARYDRQAIAAAARKRFSYAAIGEELDQVYRSVARSGS